MVEKIRRLRTPFVWNLVFTGIRLSQIKQSISPPYYTSDSFLHRVEKVIYIPRMQTFIFLLPRGINSGIILSQWIPQNLIPIRVRNFAKTMGKQTRRTWATSSKKCENSLCKTTISTRMDRFPLTNFLLPWAIKTKERRSGQWVKWYRQKSRTFKKTA